MTVSVISLDHFNELKDQVAKHQNSSSVTWTERTKYRAALQTIIEEFETRYNMTFAQASKQPAKKFRLSAQEFATWRIADEALSNDKRF